MLGMLMERSTQLQRTVEPGAERAIGQERNAADTMESQHAQLNLCIATMH